MDPYKEEEKKNPSNGYGILEKYLKEKKWIELELRFVEKLEFRIR
jgi:hypothetical protein